MWGQVRVILRTKLFVPPLLPTLVARPRLVRRLQAEGRRRLILIAAPPGFGKTTLLAEWRAADSLPMAWLSIDEADNDPMRFWTHVAAALGALHAGVADDALALLRSPQPPNFESMMGTLVNAMAGVDRDFWLVLDDYHLIAAESIHQAVAFLLEHLPPQAHLVMMTRSAPPLPLPRLRVRGQAAEFGPADLRFTVEEAAAFMSRAAGLELDAETVGALEARTEGWAAGLQLAALSVQGRADGAALLAGFSGSQRHVFDYLAEEVLARQPEAVRAFLQQTAVLPRLSGPLCDAVTGAAPGESQRMLERLEQANLFLVPLDDHREWYRYHHLLADFLRAHLEQGALPALKRRAGDWFAANGWPEEALAAYTAAGCHAEAAEVVEAHAEELLTRSEVVRLQQWLAMLPSAAVDGRARLGMVSGWVLATAGRLDEAERSVQMAAALDPDLRVEANALFALTAALRGDAATSLAGAREALEELSPEKGFVRCTLELTVGGAHVAGGDLPAAALAFARAWSASERSGNTYVALVAIANLVSVQARQGQLQEAVRLARQALAYAAEQEANLWPVVGAIHVALGELLYEWNDLPEAEHHLRAGIDLGRRWGNAAVLADGYCGLARLLLARGSGEQALAALREGEQVVEEQAGAQLSACRAEVHLAQGDLPAALRWADSYAGGAGGVGAAEPGGGGADSSRPGSSGAPAASPAEQGALARVRLAQGRWDEAAHLLDRLAAVNETQVTLKRLTLQALLLQARGAFSEAVAVLRGALALARPERFVRTFLDAGPALEGLLARAEASPSHGALAEPLSDRELDVLRLIAAGHPNRVIAQQLFVAEATVKKHINNLYSKLGAESRTQAVARARELKLLP